MTQDLTKLLDALTKLTPQLEKISDQLSDAIINGEVSKQVEPSEKERIYYRPTKGEKYFVICDTGIVDDYIWMDDPTDNDYSNMGNVFRTREDAERELERIKVIAEMRKFAAPPYYLRDKKYGDQTVWYMACHCENVIIPINVKLNHFLATDMVFLTRDDIEKCIETVGEERIVKYWFGRG